MFLHLTTPRLLCLDNLVVLKSAPCVFKSAHLLLIDCHRPEHSVLAIISSLSQSFVFKLRGRTQSLGPEQYVITFFLLSPVGNHPPNVFVFICIPAACVMTVLLCCKFIKADCWCTEKTQSETSPAVIRRAV